jgi:hypothetical protein
MWRTVADGDGTPMREYFPPDPDEQLEEQRNELEREQAAYDAEIDRRIDEWRETGVKPALPRRRK